MKLGIVFDGLRFGGIERVGIDYIHIFKELGYDVTVFNLNPSFVDMEEELKDECEIIHVNYPRWLAPERYAATLKNTWWGKYIYPMAFLLTMLVNVFYKVLLRSRKPFRIKYDLSISFAGHVNDLSFVAYNFISSKRKMAWLHGALYGYAIISPGFLRLYSKIRNLVSLSSLCDAEFYKICNQYNIRNRKIYNPISISEKKVDNALVNELKSNYGDFCLMVARMDVDKDQKTAIDALRILYNEYGLKKNLLLVGDGKTRNELEKYVSSIGLNDQVHFIGKRSDVQNFYSAASVYVHSSPLEGLPTVLLEAMYYHLPIASTDSIPGVREILGNNEFGLISDVYDSKSLATSLYRLYTDKSLSDMIISKGQARLGEFSPSVIRERLADYLKVIDSDV